MKRVQRKFKWYDWIPVIGMITTDFGSKANGNSHFETLLWGMWLMLSTIGILILLGLLIGV